MIFTFEQFELDTSQWELRSGGASIALEPKAFNLLVLLIENSDRVLSKDEIFDHVWPNIFVSEATLSTAVKQVRKAIGDDGQSQKFIKTIRGRGFRFVAEVITPVAEPPKPAVATMAEPPDDIPTEKKPLFSGQGPPVIAVLPFDLLGTETTHSAIAEALPSELIATFAQLKCMKVVARASSFQFRGPGLPIEEIRYKLGADYILSGSVELSQSRLSVFVELADARTAQVVWSEAINAKIDDIFDLRLKIARDIASIVEYRLALNETERLNRVPSENLDAWGHYHRGVRAMFHYNQSDNEAAGHHFARAAEIDPNFARAHAALSYTEFQNYFQQFGEEFAGHKSLAMEHAENAVRLDPFDPYCNLMLGRAKWIDGDPDGGLACINKSLDLSPNYAFAFYNSALLNTILCDGERAETHVATAFARSPIDPHIQTMLGTRALAAFVRDDVEPALYYADEAMMSFNAHVHVYLIAAGIHAVYGNDAKVERALKEVKRRNLSLETSGFRKHFKLRSETHGQKLFGALEQIGA